MAPERRRRQQLLLGALIVVLVIGIYRMWPTSATPAPASNRQGQANGARAQTQVAAPATPDVHLEALDSERPKPGAAERDLFRFKPQAAPSQPLPRPMLPEPAPGAQAPAGPPPPPSVPPITLKFVGIIEQQASRLAVLSDGRGAPFIGKEGEIVDGRYRILKIGVESIEIAYADGRGRQTIRLSGQ
jgi:hypothetical protein